ncbi:MAG: UTP--glucose-1-phosphate uridylyltransferase [Euryarchaeota archaeon]|nr:UTP--glucose-1-phosphate uridylyltransferase [Euryarchaeota archaeon]MDE1836222.1 UTP--glucose-1-phosphate uridylyltransferase [Euryarchaeota archaeon]MDE1880875.1 UTP--glucose-1-phosphate uridylyltransferase [Euryarchaeota archaeon]MDE2045017.1 UTP--glucose-1-phosphate uridylyltransferase [Thermoplasmata archaeon]
MKVVIPAAGQGTRFLPATKSMPKEMLPVIDRPVIQYVVEEAIASGADDITIITGRGKRALEDHFDHNPELGKFNDLPSMRSLEELADRATIHFVRQRTPRGLADAVACSARHVGREAFGILLGDTINLCRPPLLRQLWNRYEELGSRSSVIAVEPVPDAKVSDYGIVAGPEVRPGVFEVQRMVEKPPLSKAPSRLGITGAYVLTPAIFDAIRSTPPGRNQEVQLTDALDRLRQREKVYAVTFQGTRYDIGDRFLWLRTNLEFAMRDPELRDRLRPYLKELLK